jgi:putative aldouronate transport system substrate-binding protein
MDFKLIWDETITKIMIGELPVDEFDKLLTQWYAKGGKAYVEQMNAYIASTQK